MNYGFHGGLLKNWYKKYCTQKAISLAFLGAFFWSVQFYLAWIGVNFELLNAALGILAIYIFLNTTTNQAFFMGAFVGLFMFYWISFSLYYYELSFLIVPFLIILAFTYGLIFMSLAFIKNRFFWLGSALLIFWFDYLAPFGFNWLLPEALFANSFFGVSKLNLAK